MKAVLFAGGFGTRLSEATNLIPKPMVEAHPVAYHENLQPLRYQ